MYFTSAYGSNTPWMKGIALSITIFITLSYRSVSG
jgi:hypothetical protein